MLSVVTPKSQFGLYCIKALLIITLVGACKREPDYGASRNEIVIGAYLPLTGPTADFGTHTVRGIRLAFDEVNRNGGIQGRRLRLIALDDQGKADETGNAVLRLIDIEGAVAILGEVASSLSLVGGRICQRRRIPMIATSSTNVRVTQIGDYIFRACFIDPFQGFVMARFARENLGLTRVAILKDVRSDYSTGLTRSFREAFARLGGNTVLEISYGQGDTDFSAQITAIKAANVQGVYIPGYYGEVANIARQARRLGLSATLLGGDGWDSPQLHAIGGRDIEGSYFSNDFHPDSPEPKARHFTQSYKKRYGVFPSGLASQGYDGAGLLIDALRRSKTIQPKDIRDALATIRDFTGVTGNITMDINRNPIKPIVILKVGYMRDLFEATILPN